MATRRITQLQAERALQAVKDRFPREIALIEGDPECHYHGPELMMEWDGPGRPAIGWEDGAPEAWATQAHLEVRGVHAEAFDGYTLCLYPA